MTTLCMWSLHVVSLCNTVIQWSVNVTVGAAKELVSMFDTQTVCNFRGMRAGYARRYARRVCANGYARMVMRGSTNVEFN